MSTVISRGYVRVAQRCHPGYVGRAGDEVLHEHVGAGEHPMQELDLCRIEVEEHRLFAVIESHKYDASPPTAAS